jgi:site-specific recombinase XerC
MNCAERWLAHERKRAEAGQITLGGVKAIEGRIRKHWTKKWDKVCTHEIRKAHLQDWAMELQSEGLAPASIAVRLSNLRSMLTWLKDRQELVAVPVFPSVKIPENAPRLLTREQQIAVLEEIPVKQRGSTWRSPISG